MPCTLRPTLAAAALVLAVGPANAVFVVDTGPGSSPSWTLGPTQSLAAMFTLGDTVAIDSIEGWVEAFFVTRFRIDLLAGDKPGGTPLFSAVSGATRGNGAAWEGAFGLGWVVPAGDYTLEFRGLGNNNFAMPGDAPRPLGAEWFQRGGETQWNRFDGLNFGVRVAAAPIPEPSTWALWAFGLAALGALSGARRSKAS